jgi:tyrosine-protein kinase Etk/Wzc
MLARQFEPVKLDEAKEGAPVQVIDPAIVLNRRSFPPRGLITAGGFAAGLLLGMLIALAPAALTGLRRNPESNAKLNLMQRTGFNDEAARAS